MSGEQVLNTERQKSYSNVYFRSFLWFKTDQFIFKYYSDDMPVSEDYFYPNLNALVLNPQVLFFWRKMSNRDFVAKTFLKKSS